MVTYRIALFRRLDALARHLSTGETSSVHSSDRVSEKSPVNETVAVELYNRMRNRHSFVRTQPVSGPVDRVPVSKQVQHVSYPRRIRVLDREDDVDVHRSRYDSIAFDLCLCL